MDKKEEWKEELTEEEIIWINKIEKYHFKRELDELKKLNNFRKKIKDEKIKYLKRGKEGWEESVCPINRLEHVTRIDRKWTPEIIEDVLMKRRHPLSLRII